MAAATFPRLCGYIAQDLGNCLCTAWQFSVASSAALRRRGAAPCFPSLATSLSYTDVYYSAVTRWRSLSLSLSLSLSPVYMCVCVCVYIYMYVCIYIYIYICLSLSLSLSLSLCLTLSLQLARSLSKPWMKLWRNERTAESLSCWSVHWLRSIIRGRTHAAEHGSKVHSMQ